MSDGHEVPKVGPLSHEVMACQLLGAAEAMDASDEWGQRRKTEYLAEAQAHATLAVAVNLDRIANELAMQEYLRRMRNG